MYASLVASGMITPSPSDARNMDEEITDSPFGVRNLVEILVFTSPRAMLRPIHIRFLTPQIRRCGFPGRYLGRFHRERKMLAGGPKELATHSTKFHNVKTCLIGSIPSPRRFLETWSSTEKLSFNGAKAIRNN